MDDGVGSFLLIVLVFATCAAIRRNTARLLIKVAQRSDLEGASPTDQPAKAVEISLICHAMHPIIQRSIIQPSIHPSSTIRHRCGLRLNFHFFGLTSAP